MSTDADKVRAAADYIERVGLHKGSFYDHSAAAKAGLPDDLYPDGRTLATFRDSGVPCCTAGALAVAALDQNEGFRLAHGFTGGRAVGPWNDAPERTAEEVVAKLREFADSLDAQPE